MALIQRHLLAVADRPDSFLFNSQIHQILRGFHRPFLTERQVVFGRSPFVAMAFNHKLVIPVFQIRRRSFFQNFLSVRSEVILVEIKVDVGNLQFLQNRRGFGRRLFLCLFSRLPGRLFSRLSLGLLPQFFFTQRPFPRRRIILRRRGSS